MLAKSDGVLELDEWKIRFRLPEGEGPYPVLLLLHGWTGDENVMWIFTQRLPDQYLLLSPRGLFPVPQGGYGWHPQLHGVWPGIEDFRPAVDALIGLIARLKQGVEGQEWPETVDFSQVSLTGFSQGAALAYTFAMLHPDRLRGVAGLSGFFPENAESLVAAMPLKGKQAFVAHGTRDETVPVARARRAVEQLQRAGAKVTYCEDDVGHKLSATCFRGMEAFFAL